MNDLERKKYKKAVKFLSLASSEYGADIREKHKDLIAKAEAIIDKYGADYLYELSASDNNVKSLLKDIQDAKETIELLGTEDISIIKPLNDLIESATKKVQEVTSFDPSLYYTKYFFGIESKQTEQLATDLMADENFKLWFANSKVVNEDGTPKIVYHGSSGLKYEFDKFSFSSFPAVYFAENKSYSDWFAEIRGGKGIVFQCYLRVTTPIDLTRFYLDEISYQELKIYLELEYGYPMPNSKMLDALSNTKKRKVWEWLRFAPDILKRFKATKEFDGIHYYENNPQQLINGKENVTPAWIVFQGNQIKSADLRNFTYSLFTDKITMKKGGKL